jgi:lon-related putative ATP-dependent protease
MGEPGTDLRARPEQLYRHCDPESLGFETTADVAPIRATVGQDRALASLDLGLEIQTDGYNLFVAGPSGTGRNTTLREVATRIARDRPTAPDWCYVHNFQEPRQPAVISMPPGRARAFEGHMKAFIDACRKEVSRQFESDAYTKRRDEFGRELQEARERILSGVEQEAREHGFTINITPMGIATIPLKVDGEPMSREEFLALPEGRRKELQESGEGLQSRIAEAMTQVRRLEKDAQSRLGELDKTVALYAITPLLNEVRQEYMDIPRAVDYLEQVEDDIVRNLGMFRGTEQPELPVPLVRPPVEEFMARYTVNVVVEQHDGGGAPVVTDNNPTFYNLFGRVDYRSQLGAVTTDHTMIKAGSLHQANGGYLILQALDVLMNPLVWENLKRAIRCREARIENLGEQFSAIPVATLTPEPIPLDVKVVLVGNTRLYHLLIGADEDFRKLFRVKADFGIDMERSDDCVKLYAGFVASRVQDENLRLFDKTAVARVIEHGSRLVDHQEKLSTRFIDIGDVLAEADYWAGKAGSDVVRAGHVEQAIEQRMYRSSMIEESIHDLIEEGTIMIDTTQAVPGQVNGIAVYDLGDYRFGRPSRITASVSLGRGQVVSIDRETQLSGRIHNKGFAILSGYLHSKFGQDRPLSLSASIGFEQTYDEVDGDSASAAELYALLSAISGVPLRQGIAVTGSVNQRGEVQAIGGVNEKIEGFFAVCKTQGLTGNQGVVIPRGNGKHLMLRKDVVGAIREGKFHVWLVSHVNEGIEILTGVPAGDRDARKRYPAGSINRLVTDRLLQMSRKLSAAGRRRQKPQPPQQEDENDTDDEKPAP